MVILISWPHLHGHFWKQGEVQYFIGVQLDGSEYVEPFYNCIPESTAKESAKLVCIFSLMYYLKWWPTVENIFNIINLLANHHCFSHQTRWFRLEKCFRLNQTLYLSLLKPKFLHFLNLIVYWHVIFKFHVAEGIWISGFLVAKAKNMKFQMLFKSHWFIYSLQPEEN